MAELFHLKEGGEALVVEIVQTEGFDLDITDLPGLKDKTQPDHQHIAEIVRGYLQDSDCLPVVLCRAPQSHEVAHDLDSLYSLGLDPSRSILVVNYFNHVFRDFTRVSDLNKYCSGFQGRCDGVFFAQLHIEDGFRQAGQRRHFTGDGHLWTLWCDVYPIKV